MTTDEQIKFRNKVVTMRPSNLQLLINHKEALYPEAVKIIEAELEARAKIIQGRR